MWDNHYANHQKKGAFKHLKVANFFMGDGTTLVEGLHLGMLITLGGLKELAGLTATDDRQAPLLAALQDPPLHFGENRVRRMMISQCINVKLPVNPGVSARRLTARSVVGVLLAALLPGVALAQAYPNKPVKVLVPFVAGGTSDIVARAVAQRLTEAGYTAVVENRPGANGSVAAEALAKSAPDGYTIMVGSIGVFAINMGLYRAPRYNVLRDFDPITVVVRTPNVLITPPNFPASTLKEFIEYARKNPGKISYGSSGSGSSDHLSAELFKQQTNTFGVHIPYRGGAAAQTDIMAGQIEASFQNFGTVVPYIRAGKMKALAVTSAERMPQLPNVPTVIENGLPGFEVTSWQAVAAPKGVPKEILAKLHADITKGMRSPEVVQRFTDQGFELVLNTPEQTTSFFASEIERWGKVVKISGATVD